MDNVREIGACRLCGSIKLQRFVDFGTVALGNDLRESAAEARALQEYPLMLCRCPECGHFQLGHAVAPEILYATNYTYLSGIGPSFIKHFDGYAEWVSQTCKLASSSMIVDVGSNDGTALKAFKARGHRVCGVDPAQMAARIANKNGIDTINAFFDADVVARIKAKYGPADYVTSHNVLAHVDDLAATFRSIYDLVKMGGYFGFEIGYFREVLQNNYFDTIYHEHLDYHHASPLVRHLTALGYRIEDLSVNSVQGGSLRVLARKTGEAGVSPAAQAFLREEENSVLNDEKYLSSWRDGIMARMRKFRELLRERVDQGKSIAGYGAPTKATLLTKMAGIGQGDVAYVVEDNALKVGRFLPRTAIPILPTAQLISNPPDVLVIFAWNFASDIRAKLQGKINKPVEVVIPLPEPSVSLL